MAFNSSSLKMQGRESSMHEFTVSVLHIAIKVSKCAKNITS